MSACPATAFVPISLECNPHASFSNWTAVPSGDFSPILNGGFPVNRPGSASRRTHGRGCRTAAASTRARGRLSGLACSRRKAPTPSTRLRADARPRVAQLWIVRRGSRAVPILDRTTPAAIRRDTPERPEFRREQVGDRPPRLWAQVVAETSPRPPAPCVRVLAAPLIDVRRYTPQLADSSWLGESCCR